MCVVWALPTPLHSGAICITHMHKIWRLHVQEDWAIKPAVEFILQFHLDCWIWIYQIFKLYNSFERKTAVPSDRMHSKSDLFDSIKLPCRRLLTKYSIGLLSRINWRVYEYKLLSKGLKNKLLVNWYLIRTVLWNWGITDKFNWHQWVEVVVVVNKVESPVHAKVSTKMLAIWQLAQGFPKVSNLTVMLIEEATGVLMPPCLAD
jgi:hypothetical protein